MSETSVRGSGRLLSAIALQLAIALVTLGICLATLEIYFRITASSARVSDDTSVLRIFSAIYPVSKPEIVSLKKNFRQRWNPKGIDTTIETDSVGLRSPSHSEMETAEVLVMGDSFTFGLGVEGKDRYGVLIGEMSDKNTYISGTNNGWAPPHYLKYFLLNKELTPQRIIVGLYLGNDLWTDIRETIFLDGPEFDFEVPFRTVNEAGVLVNSKPLANPVLEWFRRNSAFAQWLFNRLVTAGYQSWFEFKAGPGREPIIPNWFNPESLDRGEATPEAVKSFSYLPLIEKACQERNPDCTLHVLLIPQDFLVYDERNAHTRLTPEEAKSARNGSRSIVTYAKELCAEMKLDCFNPISKLRATPSEGADTYIPEDHHWTADGHQIVAESLCDHLPWCNGKSHSR
jgi:hypothetical protein